MIVRLMGPRMAAGADGTHATPLLAFLAQEHADKIARVWPAPHEGFLVLPTPRRHAAAIALCGAAADVDAAPARIRHWVTHERDSAIAHGIAGDRAPGLARLLGKLGEQLWTDADYRGLLKLFGEDNANRALRHMQAVTPDMFQPIRILPEGLRSPRVLDFVQKPRAAKDLAIAFDRAVQMHGPHKAKGIAKRWTTAATRDRLFEMAREDLCPVAFCPALPPPVLPAPFEAINAAKALKEAALEFENCLRSYEEDIARGRLAIYLWRGPVPAALALSRDVDGWRLAEAEAANNEELDEATLRAIVPPLTRAGVRTGPAVNVICQRLVSHGRGEEPFVEDEGFVAALELGDLWN